MVDSYAFSDVIRLKLFLITGKWVIFTSMHFVSSNYMFDYKQDNTTIYIRRLTLAQFLRILLSLGLLSGDLKFILDAFSLKNLLHYIKKWRVDPEITKKLSYFLFYFWVENMLSPNIRDLTLKTLYFFLSELKIFLKGKKSVSMKSIHDFEDSVSDNLMI